MLGATPERITLDRWVELNGNMFVELVSEPGMTYLQDTNALTMKFLLSSLYGQRKTRFMFEDMQASEVAEYIQIIYGANWERKYKLHQQIFELEGESMTLAQDDLTSDVTRITDTNQTNKTSGFDSDDMVVNDGADILGNDDTKQTSNTSHKAVNESQAGLMERAQFMSTHKFYHGICKEIADLMTIAIY